MLVGVAVLTKYRKRIIIFAILLPLLIFPFLPSAISNRVLSTFDIQSSSNVELYGDVEVNNTTNMRLRNYKIAFNDICEHPFLGIGIGHYHGEEKGEFAPHNSYLRILAECGPIAIFGFLWFLSSLVFSFASRISNVKEDSRWLLIGYFAIIFTQITYMMLGDWAYQIYFWLFAGFATASIKVLSPNYVFKN